MDEIENEGEIARNRKNKTKKNFRALLITITKWTNEKKNLIQNSKKNKLKSLLASYTRTTKEPTICLENEVSEPVILLSEYIFSLFFKIKIIYHIQTSCPYTISA